MNIENLLGKLLQETMGSSGSQSYGTRSHQGHGHSQHSSSGSLLGSLTDQLTNGKGLMTAIGLGVGAYEIFRTSGQQQAQMPSPGSQPWDTAPSAPGAGMTPPPPPPPPLSNPAPASAPIVPAAPSKLDDQEMARRLLRVMVAAAHADGTMDANEEKAILDRLRGANLSQEEKMFLLEELHHPRPIAELTEGIRDLKLAQTMYAVALSAIVVDTESERKWLDELGAALGLSAEIRRFIEETR